MTESREVRIRRLAEFAKTPVRQPMSRSRQFPHVEGAVLRLRQEVEALRAALREALVLAQTPGEGLTTVEWDHLQSVLVWAELRTRIDENYNDANREMFDALDRVFAYRRD